MHTYFACLISRMISDIVSKFTISFCTYIGTIILFAVYSWNCYAIRSHSRPWTPDHLWEYLCISGFANAPMGIPFILLLLWHLVPSPIFSNCCDKIPRTCYVFTRLFTSNTPWYFLDFALSSHSTRKITDSLKQRSLTVILYIRI